MVKIGKKKIMPLGMGEIELTGKEDTIHVKITGMGTVMFENDFPPTNAHIFVEEMRKTYTPELDDIANFATINSGLPVNMFLQSGKNAIREVEEWLYQVEMK